MWNSNSDMLHISIALVKRGLSEGTNVWVDKKGWEEIQQLKRDDTNISGSENVMCKGPVVERTLVSLRVGKSGVGEVESGLSQLGHVRRGSPYWALQCTIRKYDFPLRIRAYWRVVSSIALGLRPAPSHYWIYNVVSKELQEGKSCFAEQELHEVWYICYKHPLYALVKALKMHSRQENIFAYEKFTG